MVRAAVAVHDARLHVGSQGDTFGFTCHVWPTMRDHVAIISLCKKKKKKKLSSSTAALARILPRMLLFLLHMQGAALVGCSCRRPATFEAGQEPHGATRPCRGHRRRHLLRCGGGSLLTRGCVLCQTPDLQVSFNILALNDGHHASAHAPRNTGRNMLFL